MVLLGHKKLQLYEIDQTFDANVTDDNQIISMCYSKKYAELHLGYQFNQIEEGKPSSNLGIYRPEKLREFSKN